MFINCIFQTRWFSAYFSENIPLSARFDLTRKGSMREKANGEKSLSRISLLIFPVNYWQAGIFHVRKGFDQICLHRGSNKYRSLSFTPSGEYTKAECQQELHLLVAMSKVNFLTKKNLSCNEREKERERERGGEETEEVGERKREKINGTETRK